MLSSRKLTTPPASASTSRMTISTRRRSANDTRAFMDLPARGSARGRAIYKEAAPGDNAFPRLQSVQYLDQAVTGAAGANGPNGKHLGRLQYPHVRTIALIYHGARWHRRRLRPLTRQDAKAGEHLRLECAVGVVDDRAHRQSMRIRVYGRGDVDDARGEGAIRVRQHSDFDRLTTSYMSGVGFPYVADHPHAGHIGDGKYRRRGAGLRVLAQTELPIDDDTGDRGDNLRDCARMFVARHGVDGLVGVTEDSQAIAHRPQARLGRAQVSLGLQPIGHGAALGIVQGVLARFVVACQLQLCKRGGQIALCLRKFRGLNRCQRLTGLDVVAQLGNYTCDAPRVGRKHRCAAIGVYRNLALGNLLADELMHSHRLDGQGLELLGCRTKGPWSRRGGRFGGA